MHFRSRPYSLLIWQNDGQGFNHQKGNDKKIEPQCHKFGKFLGRETALRKRSSLVTTQLPLEGGVVTFYF
jgi:hypothetical protein